MSNSIKVFDATQGLLKELTDSGHVTQGFYDELKDAIAQGKAIKVLGVICSVEDTSENIIISRLTASYYVAILGCITIFPDLRVEIKEPSMLVTESELNIIKRRLTVLESKA